MLTMWLPHESDHPFPLQVYIEAEKSLQLSRNLNTCEDQVRDVTSTSSQDDVSKLEKSVTQMVEEVEKSEERVRANSSRYFSESFNPAHLLFMVCR